MSTGATQAAGAVQGLIDETQTLDAIEYGIRALELRAAAYCAARETFDAQITAGVSGGDAGAARVRDARLPGSGHAEAGA